MSDGGVLIFSYDGSFDGMLSMIYRSFELKEIPAEVFVFGEEEPTLFKVIAVETDARRARVTEREIKKRLGERGLDFVKRGFLYDGGGKEIAILRFVHKCFKEGAWAMKLIANPEISRLFKMTVAVGNEQNMLLGFVRFSEVEGALFSVIHPKHFVLPLMKSYFCARLWNETFMIYDYTHDAALIHSGQNTAIVPLEKMKLPDASGDAFYRELWKSYYSHAAIAGRFNPACRMAHMPKRFWADLPEVRDELEESFKPKLSLGRAEEIRAGLAEEKQQALPGAI